MAEITVIELLDRYDAGERDFRGLDLSGLEFFGASIGKRKFITRGAKLEESGPKDGRLTRVDFTGAKMFTLDIGRRNIIFDRTIMPDGSIRTDSF